MDSISLKRHHDRVVVKAFEMMIRDGEAVRTTVKIPLQTGGSIEKVIYKVIPTK